MYLTEVLRIAFLYSDTLKLHMIIPGHCKQRCHV